jgi:hypothetical protein
MSIVQQAGLVNSQNSHFSNPGFSSNVGAVSGCGGSVTSADALNNTGMYSMVKTGGTQTPSMMPSTQTQHMMPSRPSNLQRTVDARNRERILNKTRRSNKGTKRRERRERREEPLTGGNGYGFLKDQTLAHTSGVHGAHLAEYGKYENTGQNSDTNMNTSSQNGGSYGTGGNPYYSYKPSEGENLSVFAGSGYPPITRGLNSQCGGKKRASRRNRSSRKKRTMKKKKTVKKKNTLKRKKSKKSKKMKTRRRKSRQMGGQYMSNVANTHTYSTGGVLSSSESALATPTPFTPTNNCLDTWKHLGDAKPYNQVM